MTVRDEVSIAGVPWPVYKLLALAIGFLVLVIVAVATSLSHRITNRLYYGASLLSLGAARDRDPAARHWACPRRARAPLRRRGARPVITSRES